MIDEYYCSALQWNQENLTEEEQYRLAKYFLKRRYNYSGELDKEKVEFMNKNLIKEIIGNLKVLNKHPTRSGRYYYWISLNYLAINSTLKHYKKRHQKKLPVKT